MKDRVDLDIINRRLTRMDADNASADLADPLLTCLSGIQFFGGQVARGKGLRVSAWVSGQKNKMCGSSICN